MIPQAGALVGIKTDATGETLATVEAMAKRLAMHVVAAEPRYLSPATVPEEIVTRERDVSIRTWIAGFWVSHRGIRGDRHARDGCEYVPGYLGLGPQIGSSVKGQGSCIQLTLHVGLERLPCDSSFQPHLLSV